MTLRQSHKLLVAVGVMTILLSIVLMMIGRWGSMPNTQKSQDHAALRIGVDLSPIDFRLDSIGQLAGLQYELANILFPDTTLSWKPFASKEDALTALRRGEVDIYATSYPWSSEDPISGADVTVPLYVSGFALVCRQDTINRDLTSVLHDMEQVDIYIPEKSPEIKQFLEHLRDFSYPSIRIIEKAEATPETLCADVVQGRIDYAVFDRTVAIAISERLGGLRVEMGIAFDVYQVWLVSSRDTALLPNLNTRVAEAVRSPRWHKILRRYGVSN